MKMCLVMILVKKVFIFSKTMIICLLCPLLCGLFFFWKGAKGELSYKVKKSRNPHKCVVSRLLTESDRRGSNPRSRPWQGRALPTTPLSHIMTVPFQNSHYFTLFTVCCQSFFTKIPQQLFFLQLFFLQFYNLLLAD